MGVKNYDFTAIYRKPVNTMKCWTLLAKPTRVEPLTLLCSMVGSSPYTQIINQPEKTYALKHSSLLLSMPWLGNKPGIFWLFHLFSITLLLS